MRSDLFDQRESVAETYFAMHVWAELRGDLANAEHYGTRANFIDAQMRKECGL